MVLVRPRGRAWQVSSLACQTYHQRGGYGTVFQGVQAATGASCAIKEIVPDEIFEREVTAMISIPKHVSHSNLAFLLTIFSEIFWIFLLTAKTSTNRGTLFLNFAIRLWNHLSKGI
jgi:hypothetical protein